MNLFTVLGVIVTVLLLTPTINLYRILSYLMRDYDGGKREPFLALICIYLIAHPWLLWLGLLYWLKLVLDAADPMGDTGVSLGSYALGFSCLIFLSMYSSLVSLDCVRYVRTRVPRNTKITSLPFSPVSLIGSYCFIMMSMMSLIFVIFIYYPMVTGLNGAHWIDVVLFFYPQWMIQVCCACSGTMLGLLLSPAVDKSHQRWMTLWVLIIGLFSIVVTHVALYVMRFDTRIYIFFSFVGQLAYVTQFFLPPIMIPVVAWSGILRRYHFIDHE